MHAYLICSQKEEEINFRISELQQLFTATKIEFNINSIEDIRQLENYTNLTQTKNCLIILRNFDNASIEAMNAFLKNLEEPNKNIIYILTVKSLHQILPTIRSRCEVIINNSLKLSDKVITSNQHLAANFIKMNIIDKFKTIDKIKERSLAIEFITNFLYGTYFLLHNPPYNYRKILKYLRYGQLALNNLNLNGNVNLQLINFVVNSN